MNKLNMLLESYVKAITVDWDRKTYKNKNLELNSHCEISKKHFEQLIGEAFLAGINSVTVQEDIVE